MRHILSVIWWYLRWILLLDGIFAAGAGLVCWLAGWRTAELYGSALVVVGLLAMALALIGLTSIGDTLGRSSALEIWFPRGPDSPIGAAADRTILALAGLVAFLIGGFIPSPW